MANIWTIITLNISIINSYLSIIYWKSRKMASGSTTGRLMQMFTGMKSLYRLLSTHIYARQCFIRQYFFPSQCLQVCRFGNEWALHNVVFLWGVVVCLSVLMNHLAQLEHRKEAIAPVFSWSALWFRAALLSAGLRIEYAYVKNMSHLANSDSCDA